VRIALDTDVLAHAEGLNGSERRDAALALVRRLPRAAAVIPVQALGELFNVLVRKGGKSRREARDALLSWRDAFPVVAASTEVMLAAADLAADHQLGIWDAIILSTASQWGCRLLLSEGLQEGFTWAGATVVNPFCSPQHALLHVLLGKDAE
jgi:predicted nucleic acid-binding protein